MDLPLFYSPECRLGMPYTGKRDLYLNPNLKDAMLEYHKKHYIGEKISVVVASPPDEGRYVNQNQIVDVLERAFHRGEVGD